MKKEDFKLGMKLVIIDASAFGDSGLQNGDAVMVSYVHSLWADFTWGEPEEENDGTVFFDQAYQLASVKPLEEDYQVGDKLRHKDGAVVEVLAIAEHQGRVKYAVGYKSGAISLFTANEIKSLGYKKSKLTEVTLAEVAEKFNVDVEDIRVKE